MQGVHGYTPPFPSAEAAVRLQLSTSTTTSPLSIDVDESAEMRIQRLISENPVVIFSRSKCCMCHVMKKLLSNIGVHPTVIELEDDEISALGSSQLLRLQRDNDHNDDGGEESSAAAQGGAWPAVTAPALYIGGACVGGFESLVALHLSNRLVPKLVEIGALRNDFLLA